MLRVGPLGKTLSGIVEAEKGGEPPKNKKTIIMNAEKHAHLNIL